MIYCLFIWDIGFLIFVIKKDMVIYKVLINIIRKKKMFSNVINIIVEDYDFYLCE